MKKIALAFTILCVAQLYGMEPKTKELEIYKALSQISELQQEIIKAALAVSNNLDEAVEMIKKFSILHGTSFDKLFNLQDFTKLVHALGDKFDMASQYVANKFGTEIAKQYGTLGEELLGASLGGWAAQVKINKMEPLLLKGADSNFQSDGTTFLHYKGDTPLSTIFRSIDTDNIANTIAEAKQLVQFLLTHGAIPDKKTIQSLKIYLFSLKHTYQGKMLGQALDDKVNEIRQMLESAMKK